MPLVEIFKRDRKHW